MAKEVIEKILERESCAEANLADARAKANEIIADAKASAEKIIAEAKSSAIAEVESQNLNADAALTEITNKYAENAAAETEKIKAKAATKEDEAFKVLCNLVLN